MTEIIETSGFAALSICESLILSLSERHILTANEILCALLNAASMHKERISEGQEALHNSVAKSIHDLIHRNSSVLGCR